MQTMHAIIIEESCIFPTFSFSNVWFCKFYLLWFNGLQKNLHCYEEFTQKCILQNGTWQIAFESRLTKAALILKLLPGFSIHSSFTYIFDPLSSDKKPNWTKFCDVDIRLLGSVDDQSIFLDFHWCIVMRYHARWKVMFNTHLCALNIHA